MHLRVFLSVIGQLIAVPAALFFMPTTCPDLNRRGGGGDDLDLPSAVDSSTLDHAVLGEIPLQEGVQERLSEMTTSAARGSSKDSTRQRVRKAAKGTGGGGSLSPSGLDQLKGGLEDAAENVMEAFNNLARPFQEIPRRAGDALLSFTGRGVVEEEISTEADSRLRYLGELRLAQESAERALGTPGWAEVAQRNGVTVWKKYFPKNEYGHQYPCVKARGIIDGSAEEVMGMIVDSTRVLEYNRYSKGRTDIEHLGPNTKIVWNKAQPPLSKKLHDFCTLMHMEPLEDGSFMLITRATEHPHAPLLEGHVRSEILLGVTILRPAEGDSSRTEMTTVNHIVSNGVPVMIADRVSTKNAIDFISNVEMAALAAAEGATTSGGASSISPSSAARDYIPMEEGAAAAAA